MCAMSSGGSRFRRHDYTGGRLMIAQLLMTTERRHVTMYRSFSERVMMPAVVEELSWRIRDVDERSRARRARHTVGPFAPLGRSKRARGRAWR